MNLNMVYLDQNKSLYIIKKNYVAWEQFHPYKINLEKRRDTRNIEIFYDDGFGIRFGKSKEGKFYKRVKDGPWTTFTEKKDIPVFFGLGEIIATKGNTYWTQCGKNTIIREKVITNFDDSKRNEEYFEFVAANINKYNSLYEKLVFDNTSLDKAVEISMQKK